MTGFADLAMECPCPDWRVPCRHLTATCYALARSFDEDPFGILAWRGRGRDELLGLLRLRRVERGATRETDEAAVTAPVSPVAGFWTGGPRRAAPPDDTPVGVPDAVRRPDALLDQLDPLRRYEVMDLLRPAYEAIVRD